MKNYNNELKKVNKKIKDLKNLYNKRDTLNDALKKINISRLEIKKINRKNPGDERITQYNNIIYDIDINDIDIKNTQLALKIIKHNARVALANDIIPHIINVVEKYDNKPLGEKTHKKIHDELLNNTGCHVRFCRGAYSKNHNDFITVIPADENNYNDLTLQREGGGYNVITLSCERWMHSDGNYTTSYTPGKCTDHSEEITPDNKLNKNIIKYLHLIYEDNNFITDATTRIKKIKKSHDKLLSLQSQMNTLIDEYNTLVVDGIQRISHDYTIKTYI